MKSSLIATPFIVAGLAIAAGLAAAATKFPPLQRVSVLESEVPAANPPLRLVRGAKIRFAPDQPTGLHLHPASTVGVVTEGDIVFQPEGEALRTLHAGDVFFEPAHRKILHFDNPSSAKPAAITVFYLTDSKDRPLLQELPSR